MTNRNGPSEVVVLPKGGSFNTDFYVPTVIPVINRECRRLMGNDFVFQQDGARCHTSKESIEEMKTIQIPLIEPHHWPPNSPDLNPLDYFFWNEVSKRVNAKNPTSREAMIEAIRKYVAEIPV